MILGPRSNYLSLMSRIMGILCNTCFCTNIMKDTHKITFSNTRNVKMDLKCYWKISLLFINGNIINIFRPNCEFASRHVFIVINEATLVTQL